MGLVGSKLWYTLGENIADVIVSPVPYGPNHNWRGKIRIDISSFKNRYAIADRSYMRLS